MDRPRDADWVELVDPALGLRFRYPAVTPRGVHVDRVSEHRADADGVHLRSGNGEVYVEVVRFRGLAPDDEYARHRAALEQRFGPGAVTEPRAAELGGRPAVAYAFRWDQGDWDQGDWDQGRWDQGERSVLLVPVGNDTCRIIIDPRSTVNEEILASVAAELGR